MGYGRDYPEPTLPDVSASGRLVGDPIAFNGAAAVPVVSVPSDPAGPVPVLRLRLGEAALQGLPGRVVRAIEPYSEADPAALLMTFLSAVGVRLGRTAHVLAGDVEHAARIWPLITGKTAGGSKGTSWAAISRI